MLIINPGTEAAAGATAENSRQAFHFFVSDLRSIGATVEYDTDEPYDLRDGYWEFTVQVNGRERTLDIPGDEPETTRKGEPWVSKRLYVDGSSWLWGFALSIISNDDDDDGDEA